MSEQWEMCTVIQWEITIKMLFTPSITETSKYPRDEWKQIISQLLADGWEPFHAITNKETVTYYFRRRIS